MDQLSFVKKRAEYFLQSVITTKHQTIFISIHALYNLLYVLWCRLVRHFYFTLLDLKIFLCKGLQKSCVNIDMSLII